MPELNRRQFSQDSLFDPGPQGDPQADREQRAARLDARFGELRTDMTSYAAEGVLQTGDILTQHETEDSGGFYDPEYRNRVEREGLGYQDNPVYGYLATSASDRSEYGDVSMTMKPSVKDRTTLYPTDSWYAFEEHEWSAREAEERGDPPPSGLPQPRNFLDGIPQSESTYMKEAHVHAGNDASRRSPHGESRIPLADIGRVDFDLPRPSAGEDDEGGDSRDRERSRMVGQAQRFSESGINVDMLEPQTVVQETLPMTVPWGNFGSEPDPNLADPVYSRSQRRTPFHKFNQ